jgi:predicted ATP-dependent serine protease
MNELEALQRHNIGKAIGVSVHPKISHSIALAGLAKHYFGGGTPMVIGGLLGYLIGSQTELLDSDKRQAIQEIMQSSAQLNQMRQQEASNYPLGGSDVNDGIMSASDLMNFKYNKYDFFGKWGDFVGQPSINFHAMIYGRPKQGKSILSVQWAKYLSENFGKVLYVASEEGFSVTLQKKVMEFAMDNPNLDFANFRDFEQIKNAVNRGGYRFVFIDSVNYIRITPEDVEDIKAENPQTAFITIQQATKNGNFRGSQEFAHNCDMVIRVEAGMASHQGRFQEPTEMAVFEDAEGNTKPAEKSAPLMGGDSNGQMDLFSSGDFSESAF